MQAYSQRFTRVFIQSLMFVALIACLSYTADHSRAQDIATDTPVPADAATVVPTDVPTEVPTVVPTDVPTEIPTLVPTDLPTDLPTDVPTEVVTEQATESPTDASSTAAPTEQPTQVPATPQSPDLFTENFEDGETTGWLLTPGWSIIDDAGSKTLASTTANDVATLTGIVWPYFTLTFRYRGALQLNVASGGSSYLFQFAADGSVTLFKDGTQLSQSAGVAADATTPAPVWHTVNLLAPGNLLAARVDNLSPASITDPSLIGMGPIIFSTGADSPVEASFDDISIQRLDAPPPTPTPVVIPTEVVVIPSPTAVTAEPTLEATAEATLETTAEATTEATAEATLEVTAEATVEPPQALSDTARLKLSPELAAVMDSYLAGNITAVQSAVASFADAQQRIDVTIWTTGEQDTAKLTGDITTAHGIVTDALGIRIQALVTLDGLLALANASEVSLIELPASAISTGPSGAQAPTGQGAGSEISEGVNNTGAAAWHNAATPVKGSGVGIAVIDTGFGSSGPAISGEYACLNSSTILNQSGAGGDTLHGRYMVEVLCDMAPASKVYMYKATTATNLVNALNLINNNNAIKVVVIAMDLGASVSPGDGTGGGATVAGYGIDNVYTAISTARGKGKVVIASAGNNTGRYVTLNYNSATSGTVTVPVTVFNGDTIRVSWNDWNNTLNGGLLREDFTLSLNGTAFHTASVAAGGRPLSAPSATSTAVTGCPAPTGCNYPLTIGSFVGDAGSIIIQVQVAGAGTIDDTSVSPNIVVSTAGNIARPADSQDVIAVGAVCPASLDSVIELPLDANSSHGPIFDPNGNLSSLAAPYLRDQVKPDISGPTHVSISSSRTASQDGCDTDGFNGTSAAAAHIAGMAALLVSNTNSTMSAFDGTTSAAVDAIQSYLQTHVLDKTDIPGYAVGYDMNYGAGYAMLGNPAYNYSQVVTPGTGANLPPLGCSSFIYAGLANSGSLEDGSLTNPYLNINEAISAAAAGECVVALPGEYVDQIHVTSTAAAPAVVSYESATSFPAAPSNIWSVLAAPIFVDSNHITIDGFTVQSAYTFPSPYFSVVHPQAFRILNPNGTTLQNNSFNGFKLYGGITDGTSANVLRNTFSNFSINSTTASGLTSSESDTAVIRVLRTGVNNADGTVIGLVTISNNIFSGNSITAVTSGLYDSPWQSSLIGLRFSRADIFNNKFLSNKTGAVIGVDQWRGSPGAIPGTNAEVRVFGNLFNANSIYGPLMHLFNLPRLRFVNNSVVNNTFYGHTDGPDSDAQPDSDPEYDGYFIYGILGSAYGDVGTPEVEIHNNLFYGSGVMKKGLLDSYESTLTIGCASINAGTPIRYNWFYPFVGTNPLTDLLPGECTGKISNSIDEPITAANFFGTVADAVDPFRLRPTDPTITNLKGGINTGDNQALIDMFGLANYTLQLDLRDKERVVIGGNPNPAYSSLQAVDIGAYELGTPSAPVAQDESRTIAEDSATSVVFTLKANGGYAQAFTITSLPTEFDPSLTNACSGQPILLTPPNIVTYCPPANFHTSTGPGNVPITIGFSVEDPIFRPGEVTDGTITLTITPVDDGSPNNPALNSSYNYNLLSDYVTPIVQQLTPSYQMNNFVLNGSSTNVDFPYVYAFGSLVGTNNATLLGADTTQVVTDALIAANTNGGKFIVNPIAGQQGYFTFTYTLKDRDNQSATGTISIVVLPFLAKDGLYDDASFNFIYNGAGWSPSYIAGAYNNTLHASSIATDTVEIPFTGTAVRFNLRGSPTGTLLTNTLKLAFKLDLAAGGVSYNDYATTRTTLGNGFTCINSLNNAQPDVSSNVTKFSAASAAFNILCSGFPAGKVHSIRLTNNLANAAMTVDSAEVSAGTLTSGKSYQESNANFTYTGTWTSAATTLALGGTWRNSRDANGKVSFSLDNTIGRLVIYRTTGTAAAFYGSMQVYIDSVLTATISNISAAQLFGQPYVMNITPGTHVVEIRNVGTGLMSLDQIDTLPVANTLTVGTYEETYPDLTYGGNWTTLTAATGPLGGSVRYTNVANNYVKFKVDSAVGRVTIYRTTAPGYGSTQVYIDGAATPAFTIPNAGAAVLYGQPYSFTVTPGNHTIELRNVGATYSSLDRIVLQAPPLPLTVTPGVYEETEPNFTFSGTWVQASNAAALGGAYRYTIQKDAALTFTIDSSVTRVVIYRTISVGYGSMQVLLDGSTTPVATISNANTALLYGQPYFLNIDFPGTHTITIKNVAATNSSIDRITLLGTAGAISTTTPSATGTYEETEPNLNYSGIWLQATNAAALGSGYRYTIQKDASASFTVDSNVSRVVIYRTTGVGYGSMDILVNGTLVVNVSNVSGTLLYGQPYVLNIPFIGTNTIVIKNKAATNSNIDRIVLWGAASTITSTGTYQENDPAFTYSGAWTQAYNAAAIQGGYRFSIVKDANLTFTINNSFSRMIIYRTMGVGYGSMDVLIDNVLKVNIPNAAASTLFGQPVVVDVSGLAVGTHTVKINNKSALNSNIDQIQLLGAPATLSALTDYQENDANFTYSGNWIQVSNAAALQAGYRYTVTANAFITFSVNTTAAKRMVIYRTMGAGYGSFDVLVDGVFKVNISNVAASLLYAQPAVVDLSSLSVGTHTIKLNNKTSTNSNIDQITLLGNPVALSALTNYQETDVNLTYTGNWIQANNASALQGAYRYTIAKDANVTFSVDTTTAKRMVIYRTIGVGYGSWDLSIDNVFSANISNVGTALLFGQPYVVDLSGLSAGVHTIKLNNKTAANSSLDQITLLDVPATLTTTPGIYQENDVNLTYTGNWIQANNTLALQGAYRYTIAKDANVTFSVDTTTAKRMVIYRTVGVGYGSFDLSIDNAFVVNISNVATALQFGQPYVVDLSGLSAGTHIVKLNNKTAANSSLDQIVLLGTAQELGTGVYQETDSHFLYAGNWTQSSNANMFSGAYRFTIQAGANVTFTINSTVSRVVLYRATGVTPTYGSLQVFLDGAATPLTTISNVSTSALYQQAWVITIATPGSHLLTLKNVAATNSNIDQIELLGAPAALTAGTYQESDLNLTYSGTWAQTQTAAAFLGARRTTTQLGASVKFTVGAAVTRVVIYRTTGPAASYGSMQIFLDGSPTATATMTNTSTAILYGQPYFLDVSAGGHTIELKKVAGVTTNDIDQIVLMGTAPTLASAAVYEESDPAFTYTGTWARAAGTGPSGNAAFYTTNPGATITFSFTGQGFSIYRALMVGGGSFSVKIDAAAPVVFPTSATTTQWQQGLDFKTAAGTHTVVITNTSPTAATFVYFDAVRIVDIAAPLAAGEYQNTYPSLNYTDSTQTTAGGWTVDAAAGLSAGAGTLTTVPNDQMTFSFTGTGFGVMTDNVPTGANMQICYTGPSSACNTYSTLLNPKQLNVGSAVYNLTQGTYTVTVKHTGTVGQGLYIDRIFVLDTPPVILGAGTYENTATSLVYSPASLWTTLAGAYSGGSMRTASQKGALVQIRFNTSTLIVYQVASPTATKTLNVCVRLTDLAGTATSLCSTYSQRQTATTTFIAPVAFYGFGNGDHEVVIENATQGSQFSLDKILVK